MSKLELARREALRRCLANGGTNDNQSLATWLGLPYHAVQRTTCAMAKDGELVNVVAGDARYRFIVWRLAK